MLPGQHNPIAVPGRGKVLKVRIG